jgi:hypothetical protein
MNTGTPLFQDAQPTVATGAPSATQMYEAARLQQSTLRAQLDQLQSERRQLHSQLQTARNAADSKGLEAQITALDASIADVRKQVTASDALVANRAGIPGVEVQQRASNDDIPPGAMVISGLGMAMVVLLPFSIAMARRIWMRSAASATPALPADVTNHLARLERGIESVAIEVERIGEGQRFVTQLLNASDKRRQLQAQPVEPPRG